MPISTHPRCVQAWMMAPCGRWSRRRRSPSAKPPSLACGPSWLTWTMVPSCMLVRAPMRIEVDVAADHRAGPHRDIVAEDRRRRSRWRRGRRRRVRRGWAGVEVGAHGHAGILTPGIARRVSPTRASRQRALARSTLSDMDITADTPLDELATPDAALRRAWQARTPGPRPAPRRPAAPARGVRAPASRRWTRRSAPTSGIAPRTRT